MTVQVEAPHLLGARTSQPEHPVSGMQRVNDGLGLRGPRVEAARDLAGG